MKYLRYPLVALLTFVVGVALSPIHFRLTGIGCGRLIDGSGGFSITSYRSSYFVDVDFAHAGYSSIEKANEVFDQRLHEAAQVVSVTSKLDKNGMLVGRRAELVVLEPESNKRSACILWTEGRIMHGIYSSSFSHVRDFEKQALAE